MKLEITNILILVLSATLQATAIALMKKISEIKSKKNILLIILMGFIFCVSFLLYAKGLSALSLSIAQPVFSATMFVSTAVLSILIFREKIRRSLMMGIGLIISGIVIIVL